jgi:hypothetical protein
VEGGFALKEHDLIISDLLEEISFVPRGANGKEYLLIKEHTNLKGDTLKSILETPDEELQKALADVKLDKESLDVLEAVGSILKTYKDKLPAESLAILAKACGYPEPKEPEERKTDKTKDEEDDDECYGFTKEQLETMDLGVRVMIEKMAAKIDATEKRAKSFEALAKELKDAEITKAYIEKAEALPHIPGLIVEKHAPIMKILGEDHPAEFAEIYSVLKAADALLEKSSVWEEIGSAMAVSSGSAMNKIKKAAEALVRKDTSGMTYEDAVEKVLEEHPEWYEEYESERAKAIGGA